MKPQVYVITTNILAVAKFTFGHNWKAYIGVVPGRNHDKEWESVAATGCSLDEDLARFMFPDFAKFCYDR